LALALLGSEDQAACGTADVIAREAGGNPFLIDELARSASGSGHYRMNASGADGVTLEQVVGERLSHLPEEGRRLLEIVALGGRPLPLRIVGEASGGEGAADSTIRLLCARRFIRSGLRDGHEVVETVHDRIRET